MKLMKGYRIVLVQCKVGVKNKRMFIIVLSILMKILHFLVYMMVMEDLKLQNIQQKNFQTSSNEDSNSIEGGTCFLDTSEIPGFDSGFTVLVVPIKEKNLCVTDAGDCHCVISKAGVAINMSENYKFEDKAEYKRINYAGGNVFDGRVNYNLNLSRAVDKNAFGMEVEIETYGEHL